MSMNNMGLWNIVPRSDRAAKAHVHPLLSFSFVTMLDLTWRIHSVMRGDAHCVTDQKGCAVRIACPTYNFQACATDASPLMFW